MPYRFDSIHARGHTNIYKGQIDGRARCDSLFDGLNGFLALVGM